MADNPETVIGISDLHKKYRVGFIRREVVHAVKGLSLEVRRGEVFGLLGPNGSGKTTTLKILLGLLFPTSGAVEVLGEPPDSIAAKKRIGFLPEESYLYRFLNAEETLDYYGKIFGIPKPERRERIETLLQTVGLADVRKRPLGKYSKGMGRRIGIAQALINDPELLFLDEPTSGLDPLGIREMKDLILNLRERGKTVFLCSHILADVEDICDRIAILHLGELKVTGAVKDLLQQTDLTSITGRFDSAADVEAIVAEIQKHSAEPVKVEHPHQRLESFFIKTVADDGQQK